MYKYIHIYKIYAGPCSVWSGVRWDISRGLSTVEWSPKGLCLRCCGIPGYVLAVTIVCNIFD